MTEGLDLLFEVGLKSLGSGMHFRFHDAIGSVGLFRAPEARGSSFISATNGVRRDDYPPDWLADAIDKARGRHDDQLGDFTRLSDALDWLRMYDATGADLVVALCLTGRSSTIWGKRVRHYSLEAVDDVKKAQEYLRKSWDLLAILLATPDTLRRAVEANAVERWAITWARERRLGQ